MIEKVESPKESVKGVASKQPQTPKTPKHVELTLCKMLNIRIIFLFLSLAYVSTAVSQTSASGKIVTYKTPILNKVIIGVWTEFLATKTDENVDTLFFIDSYNEGFPKKEQLSSVLRIKMGNKSIHKIKQEGEVYSVKSWAIVIKQTLLIDVINFDKYISNPRISSSKVVSVDKNNLILEELNTGITHYYKKKQK